MWLVDFFSNNLGGWGTELGVINVFALLTAGWLLKREFKRIKAKADLVYDRKGGVRKILEEHDEMYRLHQKVMMEVHYRKRREKSGGREFTDAELLAGMVQEVLKE